MPLIPGKPVEQVSAQGRRASQHQILLNHTSRAPGLGRWQHPCARGMSQRHRLQLHQPAPSYVQPDDVQGLSPLPRRHWRQFGQDSLDELLQLGWVVGERAVLQADEQAPVKPCFSAFCDDLDLPALVRGPVECCALRLLASICAADVMRPPSAERTQLRVSWQRRYRLCLRHVSSPQARRSGRPNTPARVSRLCGQYLHSLGIPEPLHSLRHYFGSSLYAARQDLRLNWGASTSWGRSKGCGAAVLVVCSPADGTAMLCGLVELVLLTHRDPISAAKHQLTGLSTGTTTPSSTPSPSPSQLHRQIRPGTCALLLTLCVLDPPRRCVRRADGAG